MTLTKETIMMPDVTRNEPGFTGPPIPFTAEEEDSITSSSTLPELLNKFLSSTNLPVPNLEEIPEIDLQNIRLEGTQNPAFDDDTLNGLQVAAESLSVVTLGQQDHDVTLDVSLHTRTSPDTLQKVWEGLLKGSVSFGTAQLQIEYDLMNPKRLYGKWKVVPGEEMTFQDIPEALGILHNIPIEAMQLDLRFSSISFELQLDNGHFFLSARSAALGDAFFAATNAADTWNFVFGILIPPDKISGSLDQMVGSLISQIGIREACCIFSTMEDEVFVLPRLPELPDSTQPSFQFMESQPCSIERGIIFCAEILLSEADNPLLKIIHSATGQDRLLLQTPLSPPLTGQRFTARFPEPITLKAGPASLILKQPELHLNLNPLLVLLEGLMDVPLGAEILLCTATMEIGETQAQCSVRVNNMEENGQPRSLPSPLGLPGLHLDEIEVDLGWTFTPPAFLLGLNGTFHIQEQPAGVNAFGITAALTGPLISPQLFYGYLEQLDLETFYAAVTGKPLSGIPDFLNKLAAKQVFMYWSQISKELPDGTLVSQGIGFNGFIDLFGFRTHASFMLSRGGIQGSAQAAPFRLGKGLAIGGNGEGISLKEYFVDGSWITLKKEPEEAYDMRTVPYIEPGGAVFRFNTVASPYLYASARISFLDLLEQEAEIEISDQGFRFELETGIGELINPKWSCQLTDQATFRAKAEFTLDLDIKVGPIEMLGADLGTYGLDIEFNAQAEISGSLTEWTLSVSGKFMFEGIEMNLPSFSLTADADVLTHLPSHLADQIADFVKKNLQFPSAGDVLQKAAEAVNHALEQAGENAKALIDHASAEAAKIAEEAEMMIQTIGAGVAGVNEQAAKLSEETGQIIANGAQMVTKIADDAKAKAEELKMQVEDFPNKAEKEIKDILNHADEEVNRLAQEGEAVLKQAGEQAGKLLEDAGIEKKRLQDEADRLAGDILKSAEELAAKLEEEAAKVWKSIEDWAKEEAEKIKNFGKSPGHEIGKVFKKRKLI
ncbi:ATP synthase F0 subunit B [Paenibacillus riograndensis]|nr:ATP synthase F0 subunit B [Paenibacillus riograndensis]